MNIEFAEHTVAEYTAELAEAEHTEVEHTVESAVAEHTAARYTKEPAEELAVAEIVDLNTHCFAR